jgi:hypothetical protein
MLKRFSAIIWSLGGALVLANSAAAGSREAAPLKGLTTFFILIEAVPPEAAECGIDKESVETSLRFILGQSRMKITSDELAANDIYVRVNVLQRCIFNIELQVLTAVTITQTNQKYHEAVIWEREVLGSVANAGQATQQNIERLAKALVNDWNSVN